jgi:hypothetical protein
MLHRLLRCLCNPFTPAVFQAVLNLLSCAPASLLLQFPGLYEPFPMASFPTRSRGGLPPLGVGPDALAGMLQPGRNPDSPRRSGSNASQLFDALVMAATGGTEGAAAAPAANDTPAVDSRFGGTPQVSPSPAPMLPSTAAAAAAAAAVAGATPLAAASAAAAAAAATAATAASRGTGVHQLPSRQRSRLWSALSYGDVDSLQNALDAFRVRLLYRGCPRRCLGYSQ